VGQFEIQTDPLPAGLAYLLAVNIDNAFLYPSDAAEGRRVRHFLTGVSADLQRARRGDAYAARRVLDRGGVWSIVLNIDRAAR